MPRLKPTEHMLVILATYMRQGSVKGVACELDLAESTVKNSLASLYKRLDVMGAVEAAASLGWIQIPKDYVSCGWVGVCTRKSEHTGEHGGFRGYHQARVLKQKA